MNLAAIKEAALAATPGPWVYSTFGTQVLTGDSWSTVCEIWINKDCRFATWEDGLGPQDFLSNARHIALANPSTILSLIERVEAMEEIARELVKAIAEDRSIIRNPAYESDDAAWLLEKARTALSTITKE